MKKKAFTLAEVLITLLVIGVVAILTIPLLLQTTKDQEYKTAYKKAFSNLSNAVKRASSDELFTNASNATEYHNNFLAIMSQFKTVKECTSGTDYAQCWDDSGEKYRANSTGWPHAASNSYAFIDVSGMAWVQYWSNCYSLMVDTNGFKKPNQWGKDRFYFNVFDSNNQSEGSIGAPIKVRPISDNYTTICANNKCATENNYYGTSWIYKD